jgi:hypothetical protein
MQIRCLVQDEKLVRWLLSEPARSADAEGHITLYTVRGVGGLLEEKSFVWPIFRDAWRRFK